MAKKKAVKKKPVVKCPCCKSVKTSLRFESEKNKRYGCNGCGTRFVV